MPRRDPIQQLYILLFGKAASKSQSWDITVKEILERFDLGEFSRSAIDLVVAKVALVAIIRDSLRWEIIEEAKKILSEIDPELEDIDSSEALLDHIFSHYLKTGKWLMQHRVGR